jgi:hypothetical protein
VLPTSATARANTARVRGGVFLPNAEGRIGTEIEVCTYIGLFHTDSDRATTGSLDDQRTKSRAITVSKAYRCSAKYGHSLGSKAAPTPGSCAAQEPGAEQHGRPPEVLLRARQDVEKQAVDNYQHADNKLCLHLGAANEESAAMRRGQLALSTAPHFETK